MVQDGRSRIVREPGKPISEILEFDVLNGYVLASKGGGTAYTGAQLGSKTDAQLPRTPTPAADPDSER
jgi:hypothetical protein